MNERKIMKKRFGCLKLIFIVYLMGLASTLAACGKEEPYVYVPTTVSKEWQDYLRTLPDPNQWQPNFPRSDDVSGWEKLDESNEIYKEARDRVIRLYEPQVTAGKLGGV